MESARGLLAVWMQIPEPMEEEFNDWYNNEHVPERTSVPGFLAARRYVSLEGSPKYSALYPLRDLDVLTSDAYMKLRKGGATPWTRRIGRNLEVNIRNEYELLQQCGEPDDGKAAPYVQEVRFDAEPDQEDELLSWLGQEHMPALASLDGVRGAKLYRATVGGPKYLAVYELESANAPDQDGWKQASQTPQAQQMLPLHRNVETILGELILSAP